MALFAFGINHKTAPVNIRERVAFAPEKVELALNELTKQPDVHEAAILSTCNRTEVYCSGIDTANTTLIDWFSSFHGLTINEVQPYSYMYSDNAAIQHMFRVASGLDSMVLGEPQILGQIKDSFAKARQSGTISKFLGRLFQQTFQVAKQVRTDTAICSSPVSVAFAAVNLAKQIFGELQEQTVMLIGAGETIELAARHLHESSIGRMIVANRTVEKAHELAETFSGYAISLPEIPAHIAEADIVISSTASPLPILGKGTVESALKKRKHKPMFLVDIAVPRDIESEVGELSDVYLYTVDDLQEVIQGNMKSRQEAAKQAEEIVDNQVTHFMEWVEAQSSVSTIRALKDSADATSQEMLQQAKKMLRAGKDPDEVVKIMAHQLTNKLMHHPCSQLRSATAEEREKLLNSTKILFQL